MPVKTAKTKSAASVSDAEVAQFDRHGDDWWNADGVFRPLHRLNPVRLAYIRDHAALHLGRAVASLKGLKILDVGCGGGLLAEPMARMGGTVTGLDASPAAIAAATRHAKQSGLTIDYRCGSVEALAAIPAQRGRYDVITALEIVEHVADLDSFLAAVAGLLKPGGLLFLSTLNRTPKSFLLGIVAAEYVLRWVPRGTHDWRRFLRPSELARRLEKLGLSPADLTGVVFDPLLGSFRLKTGDVAVNYMMTANKP